MANGKKKTTMAKLNRETKMREKRHEKEARKEARKREAAEEEDTGRPSWLGDPVPPLLDSTPSE